MSSADRLQALKEAHKALEEAFDVIPRIRRQETTVEYVQAYGCTKPDVLFHYEGRNEEGEAVFFECSMDNKVISPAVVCAALAKSGCPPRLGYRLGYLKGDGSGDHFRFEEIQPRPFVTAKVDTVESFPEWNPTWGTNLVN